MAFIVSSISQILKSMLLFMEWKFAKEDKILALKYEIQQTDVYMY